MAPTPEATILAVNDAFLRMTGRRREELVGISVFEAFPENPDDPEDNGVTAFRNSLQKVLASREPDVMALQRYPIRVKNSAGEDQFEERFWSAANTPIFDQDGGLNCILHTSIDITTQVKAEAALRKSESKYRNLFESLSEGLCILTAKLDESVPVDFQICEINPMFVSLTGLPDAVGKTLRQLAPQFGQWLFEICGWVAKTGQPIRVLNELGSLSRWFDVYAFLANEDDANRISVLFRDVTDYKLTEEELRRSERQAREAARQVEAEHRLFNAVLEAAPVGIGVVDAGGAILHTNPKYREIWSDPNLIPQSFEDYKKRKGWWADGSKRHGQPLQPHEWTMVRALRGEETAGDIIEIETADVPPRRRILLKSASVIRDNEGKINGCVLTSQDITDQIVIEESLRETTRRLRFALDSAEIGDWDFDLLSETPSRSLRHDQCFGYDKLVPGWGMEKFMEHVHPEDRERVRKDFEEAVAELKDWHVECRVIWPDGSLHWIALHGSVQGARGRATRMSGIIQDITDRKRAEEELRHASLHDALTGLPNRAMLFECASHFLSHNKRSGERAAVLFLDLDRFKPINDSHGHEIGDAVLKEAANRLSNNLRAADMVIRLGGDEFVVLLQNIKGPPSAAEVARLIVEKINQPYYLGDLALSLSASIGISLFPDDGDDIDTLVSRADMAMYQAKQAGRNNYQFYSPEFAAGTRQQIAIEERLQSALRTDAFYLCYQPVLDVSSGEIVSVEALLRWQEADIGPERFVPVAETTGIINPIGRWLLKEASRQHKAWITNGLPAIPIAVNVSVVEFRDKSFVNRFNEVIREYDIDTSALQLELTETAMMDDIDYAVSALSELKTLGVKVLLDDFGTGHSSLAYLARLPLHKIKIDKSFVSRLESDVASRAVTEAMIALGRTLNLEIVAEGIESANVLEYVCSHGCGQAQGFFIGRPMTGCDFEEWYWKQGDALKDIRNGASRRH